MTLTGQDAGNILQNLGNELVAAGKKLLGDRFDKLSPDERKSFTGVLELMAKARVAELAGHPGAKGAVKILQIAIGEWTVAGETEVVIIFKQVGEMLVVFAGAAAGSLLRSAILAL